jgi:hypothetical protein
MSNAVTQTLLVVGILTVLAIVTFGLTLATIQLRWWLEWRTPRKLRGKGITMQQYFDDLARPSR